MNTAIATDQDKIAELSDEELSEQLAASKRNDTEEPAEETEEPAEETEEPAEETEEPAEETEEPAEETEEPAGDAEPAQEVEDSTETQLEALKAQLKAREDFINLQGNEVGELRKQLKAVEETNTEDLIQAHDSDPIGVTKALIADAVRQERERVVNTMNAERAQAETIRRTVTKAIPDFGSMISEVAEIALESGYEPEAVAEFKANPYGAGSDHDILISLGKQVALRRQLKESNARIAELEDSPENVARKIQEAAEGKPRLKGKKASREVDDVELTDDQILNLSDEELAKLLKKNRSTGG